MLASTRLTRRFVLATACAAVFDPSLATATDQIDYPARGTSERIEILEAARPTFEAETNGPVEFVIRTLNESADWVFGDVRVQRPGGAEIDWSLTKHAREVNEGSFDPDHSYFLLRLSTRRFGNKWTLAEISVGSSDPVWAVWRDTYNLPRELFVSVGGHD